MAFSIVTSRPVTPGVQMKYFASDLEVTTFDSSPLLSCSSATDSFSDDDPPQDLTIKPICNKPKKHVTFPDQSQLESVFEIPNRASMLEEYVEDDDGSSDSDCCQLEEEFEKLSTGTNRGTSARHSVLRQLGTYPGIIGKTQNNLQQKQSATICNLARRNAARNKTNSLHKTRTKRKSRQESVQNAEETIAEPSETTEDNVKVTENSKNQRERRRQNIAPKVKHSHKLSRPNSSPAVLRVKVKRPDLAAAGSLMQTRCEQHASPMVRGTALNVQTSARPARVSSAVPSSRKVMTSVPVPTFSALPRLNPSGSCDSKSNPYQMTAPVYSAETTNYNSMTLNNYKNNSKAFKRTTTGFADITKAYDLSHSINDKGNSSTSLGNAYTYNIPNASKIDKDNALSQKLQVTPTHRKYAWQSANGLNNLQERNTPCIAPLFEERVTELTLI